MEMTEFINMDERILYETQGHSSKGNQLKWKQDNYWYKADHMGYEGLAEIIISKLLRFSNVTDYLEYEPAQIQYKGKVYNGCRSRNFLQEGEELITVDRLYRQYTGKSLTAELSHIPSVKDRIAYFVVTVKDITRIKEFGQYITMTLEMDSFFLNEDRHTNNIAVIYNPVTKAYRESPYFDNGLALFSDTSTDFILDKTMNDCLNLIKAKPFSTDFEEQADEAAALFGRKFKLHFKMDDIEKELENFTNRYDKQILERVEQTLRNQMRKYQYLFS